MTNRSIVLLLSLCFVLGLPAQGAAANVGNGGEVEGGPRPSLSSATAPAGPALALAATDGATARTAATHDDVIHQTTRLRHLPDRPGEFEAAFVVELPDAVSKLELTLPEAAEVESVEGFDRDEGRVWTTTEDRARLTVRLPANRTGIDHRSGSGPTPLHPDDDGYAFVDVGEWGVVDVPSVFLRWWERSPVALERTVEVDGPGAAGDAVAFFGEVTEHTREGAGESFRLVVPEAADLRESPEAVLDALEAAGERLRVGARSDEVFVVAVPTGTVDWAAVGIQSGESDAWVIDDARLDDPRNAWLHEYVHTRQAFAKSTVGTTAETEWLVEAQAEYYAALLSLEAGYVEYDDFRARLREGERSPHADAVLVEPETWADDRSNYVKGALVYAELDRRIRLETDGERTAEDLFRALNRREEPVDESAVLSLVEREGGASAREFLETYTRTDGTPSLPPEREHRAAVEAETARFSYGLAGGGGGDGPITVTGPTRETAFDAPPVAVPGETLAFAVDVENVGERAGSYDATLLVDGRVVDERSDRLDAGRTATEALAWTPDEPGRYDLRIGDDRLAVEVRRPADATVTGFRVDPERVEPGDPATLIATVANDADRPANATVRFRTPDGVADERAVALAPGETTSVETVVSFEDPGRYGVAVDDRTAELVVEERRVVDSFADEPGEAIEALPGFGAPIALAVLGLAVLFARQRR